VSGQPDYYLDITGLEQEADAEQIRRAGGGKQRRWIGVHFECCDVYTRIYRNQSASAYEGRCPRCLMRVRVSIGPGGTDNRFFVAY